MNSSQPSEARATFVGAVAILMWASLAVFTKWSGQVPPFLLVAISFSIAGAMAVAKWAYKRESPLRHLRQPARAWALGVGGLFGYHFLVFLALRTAPAVEANLVNYLWPLLIVLFSALLPGERLRWYHVAGALSGLVGTGILVTGGGNGVGFDPAYLPGYLAAAAGAVTWASYSVLSRRFGNVPTDAVGGFCIVGAALAFVCHMLFEPSIWPQGWVQWAATIGLGIGPAGGAFFFWDYGVKRGNIRALGAWSYTIPLMSTGLLVLFGFGQFGWTVVVSCACIVGGALLASKDMIRAMLKG